MPNAAHYQHLKEKWTARHKALQENLWNKHKGAFDWLVNNSRQFAAGSLGGLIMLASPIFQKLPAPPISFASNQIDTNVNKNVFLISDLSHVLPSEVRPLTDEEEKKVADMLSNTFKLKVTPELEGKRLNRSYGLIGIEQHLPRFPEDNMSIHFDNESDANLYTSSGMTPGLGAWGYFAASESQLTEQDKLREKYYIAVQTFLSKDFNQRFAEYRDFYKYRKMLVVNPNNGKAIIADIADAGPSVWTGKSLGGSPEVMHYLERVDGAGRGPVLYFFVDDKDNKVQLGPIGI